MVQLHQVFLKNYYVSSSNLLQIFAILLARTKAEPSFLRFWPGFW